MEGYAAPGIEWFGVNADCIVFWFSILGVLFGMGLDLRLFTRRISPLGLWRFHIAGCYSDEDYTAVPSPQQFVTSLL